MHSRADSPPGAICIMVPLFIIGRIGVFWGELSSAFKSQRIEAFWVGIASRIIMQGPNVDDYGRVFGDCQAVNIIALLFEVSALTAKSSSFTMSTTGIVLLVNKDSPLVNACGNARGATGRHRIVSFTIMAT